MSTGARGGECCAQLATNLLSDATLLQICRAKLEDPNVTPEWLTDLRLIIPIIESAHLKRVSALDNAMTLLAFMLGQLDHHNPVHLPFGYNGPTIRSNGWLDRQSLEGVGQQIVGLIWNQSKPEIVSDAVHQAISRALHFGFMEQKDYDAWRPGMRSGTGWRSAITATLYGITRARNLANAIVTFNVPTSQTHDIGQEYGVETARAKQNLTDNGSPEISTPEEDTHFLPTNTNKAAATKAGERQTTVSQEQIPDNIFRRCGGVWQVRFRGRKAFTVLPWLGASYIYYLLIAPGEPRRALDIVCSTAIDSCDQAISTKEAIDEGLQSASNSLLGNLGKILDWNAIGQYRAKAQELLLDIEKARQDNNNVLEQQYEKDLTMITGKINEAIGIGGKLRQAGDKRKNIRDSFRNNVKRTIENQIKETDPALAAHLQKAILFGNTPRYVPEDGLAWETRPVKNA